jgi:tetratricopeptide (TPR) repeat protein
VAALFALGMVPGAIADPVPRNSAPAGSVIARKIGEEIRFIDLANWSPVELRQDLLPGDVLRTNATGQLALLFSDRTQVRLGRNATLLVKQVGAATPTILDLRAGTLWARAQRGGESLTIEAPAASAAIRGTDWTMSVDGNGKTSIIVLEGLIEFSNDFGSVSVGAGEAAVAEIGQAPVRVVIVDPKDREQMLYYLSVGGAFGWMPASPLATPRMRSERDRIAGIPEGERSIEDWLLLAETAQTYDGRSKAGDLLARLEGKRLTPSQRSRVLLLEALNAGAERRYEDAARLFEQAAPTLDPKRRAVARYGAYFARALADPNRHQTRPTPSGGGAYAVLAEAWTVGFLNDIESAIEIIQRNEALYPDEPSLPAFRAQLALLLDDRGQVEEAIAKALAISPDDPTALEARANFRSGIQGDLTGALKDLETAVAVAPGSTSIWNAIGLVQGARGANLEAERALKRAIELDPQDPVSYANLAILYLDQDRVKEAKANIDRALELDPSFDVALIARGRYFLQAGDTEAAIGDLLAGSTANPAYSQGLLLLAAGHYAEKEGDAARQALENADRIDPNDPVTKIIETSVAIDDYDADKAIAAAREAVSRLKARGGDYASLGARREGGSVAASAFRLQGLDAWARSYGDQAFDLFDGSALIDQAISGSADPYISSLSPGETEVEPIANSNAQAALLQGLLLAPELLTRPTMGHTLLRRPFVEASIGGGFVQTDNDWGWLTEAEVQSFATAPFPWSFYGGVRARDSESTRTYVAPGTDVPLSEFDLRFKPLNGYAYLTAP